MTATTLQPCPDLDVPTLSRTREVWYRAAAAGRVTILHTPTGRPLFLRRTPLGPVLALPGDYPEARLEGFLRREHYFLLLDEIGQDETVRRCCLALDHQGGLVPVPSGRGAGAGAGDGAPAAAAD